MQATNRGLFATECEYETARWVQRKLGTCEHERRVLAIAARLFELSQPTLRLGKSENRLLRLAALTHDVGRSVCDKRHPEEGARIILSTTALQLSPFDRRALAFMSRYHRGAVPIPGHEEHLHEDDPRVPLRKVLGLLRVADALDSRQFASPQILFSIAGRKLSIRCYVESTELSDARQVYRRRKKFHLLESFLEREIDVQVDRADGLTYLSTTSD